MKIKIAFAIGIVTLRITFAIAIGDPSFLPPSSVFLSFSGEDTRTGFTSHLRAALERKKLKTFMDDKDAEKGKVVLEEIIKAIQESEFAVIIFSPSYALSHWCLDEAQMLVERRNSHGLTVIPVFYGVNPSDVRHQTGIYYQHFRKLEKDFPIDKVARWRYAFAQAGSYCGWNFKDRHEAELVESIAQDILGKSISKLSSGGGITMGTCRRDVPNITSRLPQQQDPNHTPPEWKPDSQDNLLTERDQGSLPTETEPNLVEQVNAKIIGSMKQVLVEKDTKTPTKGNQKNEKKDEGETTEDAVEKKSDCRPCKSRIPFLKRLKRNQQNQLLTNTETSTEGSTKEEQSKEDGQRAKGKADCQPPKFLHISLPQRLKGNKKYKQFVKLLEMLRKLPINIPFAEVISQMSKYAKLLKEILANKRKLEGYGTVKPNHMSV